MLQEEIDEHRADTSYSRHRRGNESIGSSVFNDQHSPSSPTFHIGTAPATSMMHTMFNRQYSTPSSNRRPASLEREMRRGVVRSSHYLMPNFSKSFLSRNRSLLRQIDVHYRPQTLQWLQDLAGAPFDPEQVTHPLT